MATRRKPASTIEPRPGTSLGTEVFECLAARLADRRDDIALFTETGGSFHEWVTWEAVSACRKARWSAKPRPKYAEVGVAGSRDHADLLVFDPATGRRVLVEIAVVHEWTTNKWIAELDRDTGALRHAPVPGLQMIVAASLASPIEVNPTWCGWLGLSRIWNEKSDLRQAVQLGAVGQLLMRGYPIEGPR